MISMYVHLIGRPLQWLTDPDASVEHNCHVKRDLSNWIWIVYVYCEMMGRITKLIISDFCDSNK